MQDALSQDLNQEVIMLWHKNEDISNFGSDDCIVLPGGFSYGDYLRCGAIARFSPIMKKIVEFANKGGKVFGVCNGFQVLCEAGLLPGALLRNDKQKFVCQNLFLKPEGYLIEDLRGTEQNEKIVYKIPIAHGEGRYHADENVLNDLERNGQILYRYCNEVGEVVKEANPNGSARNIAGVCNPTRNVFGMMPHPERACSTILGNEDGKKIISNLLFAVQPIVR